MVIDKLTEEHRNAKLIRIMTPIATPAITDFLRKIGSKGGKKSAQHPERRKLNKAAAEARWRNRIPEPKAPEK